MAKELKRFLTVTTLVTVFVIITITYQPHNHTILHQNLTVWMSQYANNFINQTVGLLRWSTKEETVFPSDRNSSFFHIDKPEPTSVKKTGRYVSMCSGNFDDRRMGNQLFNFAGMVKVASLTGRRVSMVRKHPHRWLDDIFEVPVTRVENIQQELCPCVDVGEGSLAKLAERKDLVGKSLLICGWWQNWKYTEGIEMQLRYYLRFRPEIANTVSSYFEEEHPGHWPKTASPFRVGIHVRAGDIMNSRKFGFGYTIPKQPYFQKAMEYVMKVVAPRSITTSEKLFVQFYVTSDSIEWVNSTLGLTSIAYGLVNSSVNESVQVHVTYSMNNTAAVDLALLSRCDTVIMTTGTYGWWAGWLSNKTTIYYNDWPRPGSPLTGAINRAGFFPPWWVPFSGPFYTF